MSDTPPPPPARTALSLGRIVLGGLLLLIGVGWLLDSLEVDVPWEAALPVLLMVVGVVLVVTASSERAGHGGLVALGVVLTVLLLVGTTVSFPFAGGVGERRERPTSVRDLSDRYRLAIGSMTVDLRDLSASGDLTVEARVGIGELLVLLPPEAGFSARARSGVGEIRIDDVGEQDERSGVDLERTYESPDLAGAALRFDLEVSVGIGRVEIRR